MEQDLSFIFNELGEERENYFNAVSPPIMQTSNFAFENISEMKMAFSDERKHSCYTRGKNPTVEILRKKVAALENAEDALIVSSGCAAISLSVLSCLKTGDHVVFVNNPYSWTNKLMTVILPRFGITADAVDGTDPENYRKAMKPNTKIFFMESPNSYTFELQDIESICNIAKENNITTIIDNSYATPLVQKPIDLGCDIVVHSATKYFSGHSDVVVGIIAGSHKKIDEIFHNEFMTIGSILSPNDAWLVIRGMRTMEIRMERIIKTTEKIVDFLSKHPLVDTIFYPFYEKSPQIDLAKKQMKSGTGLFSIKLKVDTLEQAEKFSNSLKRFLLAVSWGGYESLIMPSCVFYDPNKNQIPYDLVRLSIGLEDPNVLIEDLKQAFEQISI